MIYTQEQVDGMSEPEKLFLAAVKLCAIKGDGIKYGHEGLILTEGNTLDIERLKLEPNDIMPIAFEYRIGLVPAEGHWFAEWFSDDGCCIAGSTNPLIAIVDVFLMMEV